MDIGHLYVEGSAAQTSHLHVVRHTQETGSAIVARQEQHGIAVGRELIVEHLLMESVHLLPDGLEVVLRAVDEHVGAKELRALRGSRQRLA